MRILSCKIANFGCYSDKTFDFKEGLNPFCLPNGGGKTTLATFIKAMLYSLEKVSKTSFERNRYKPYSGKACGGSLIFSLDDHTYRLERTFGATPSKDTLKIYDERNAELTSFQGKPVSALQGEEGKNLGELILGIDQEAFKRCNFISREDLDFVSSESIKMKIGNILIDKESENSYEDTIASIKDDDLREKEPTRKNEKAYPYRIKALEKENKQKADSIKEIDGLEQNLGELYNQRKDLKKELEDIEKQQKDYAAIHVLKGKWSTVEAFDSDIKKADQTIEEISSKYGDNIPSKVEIDSLEENIKEVETCKNLAKTYYLSPADVERLKGLEGKVPSEDDYERLLKSSNKLEENSKKSGTIPVDRKRYEELKERFAGKPIKKEETLEKEYLSYCILASKGEKESEKKDLPSENVLNQVEEDVRKYQEKEEDLSRFKSSFKEPSILLKILLTVFTLGLYLLVLKNKRKNHEETLKEREENLRKVAEELDTFFAKYGKTSGSYALRIEELRDEAAKEESRSKESASEKSKKAKQELEEKRNALFLYFSSFGYSYEDVECSYQAYKNDLKKYEDLKKEVARNEESEKELAESNEEENSTITTLLEKYGLTRKEDLKAQVKTIKDDIEFFKLKNPVLLNREKSEESRQEHEKAITTILRAHNVAIGEDVLLQAKTLLEDVENYNKAKEKKTEQIERKDTFIKENGLEGFVPTDVEGKEEELRQKHEEKNAELARLEGEINQNEEEISKKDSLNEEIVKNNEIIKDYKERIRIARFALSLLQKAEEDMEKTYISPIKDSFSTYASKICEKIGANVSMDYDYEIKYEIEGQLRESKNLSDGERTIMMLALRFAIMDAMYKDHDSFIVLDDPFESLDKENLPKAKELLQALSKDWQIIYFTCHESREMNPLPQ